MSESPLKISDRLTFLQCEMAENPLAYARRQSAIARDLIDTALLDLLSEYITYHPELNGETLQPIIRDAQRLSWAAYPFYRVSGEITELAETCVFISGIEEYLERRGRSVPVLPSWRILNFPAVS